MKNINLTKNIKLINKPYKKKGYYHFLKTANLSLIVCEIKKDKFVVVSQKRVPVSKVTYEFPSGIIDKGENPLSAACREFYEETGYKILGTPKKIFTINCEPGRLTTKIYCYYSNNIIKKKNLRKVLRYIYYLKIKLIS